jgi:hypothetical protein
MNSDTNTSLESGYKYAKGPARDEESIFHHQLGHIQPSKLDACHCGGAIASVAGQCLGIVWLLKLRQEGE